MMHNIKIALEIIIPLMILACMVFVTMAVILNAGLGIPDLYRKIVRTSFLAVMMFIIEMVLLATN